MLIKCPECKKDVSEFAEACPDCGFPIQKYFPQLRASTEVQQLMDKVKPVEFKCDEPRVKVCLKCGRPLMFLSKRNTCSRFCSCKTPLGEEYPTTEVDYPEEEQNDDYPVLLYIHDSCVVPMNIGDTDSVEYKEWEKALYESIAARDKAYPHDKIKPRPPKRTKLNPSAVQVKPTPPSAPKPVTPVFTPTPTNVPKCPICGSTSLTKISTMKKAAKIATFGIFGMGDNGKTWKCNSCGSKF